jgi:uncharacterized protein (TIGR03435 family)
LNPEKNIDEILDRYITSAKQQDVESHCAEVFQRLQSRAKESAVDVQPRCSIRRSLLAATAAITAALAIAVLIPPRILQSAPATLQDANGSRQIQYGEFVRPIGDRSSMLSMVNGPRVEMDAESEFSLERTKDGGTSLRLHRGGAIVEAAGEHSGKLYVQTRDIAVSVSGTVSLVKAEEEGSRVAVIEGELRVQQGAETTSLRPGEQMRTNPRMQVLPVPEEIAWSQNAGAHVALLQQQPLANPVSAPPELKFEVASIRQGEDAGDPLIRCKGVDGVWSSNYRIDAAAQSTPQGRCVGVIGLRSILILFYGIRIDGEPSANRSSGMDQEPFNHLYRLDAKAGDPSTVTKDQLVTMLRNLVIDRFKLRIHSEVRGTEKGYALLLGKDGKDGVKFKETSDAEEGTWGRPNGVICSKAPCPILISGKFSMKRFSSHLGTNWTGKGWVIDKTGLQGVYDLKLLLHPVPQAPRPIQENAGPRGGGSATGGGAKEYDPPLPKAIEEQLGLRLEYGHDIPLEHWIIDHIEMPTEN